MVNQDFLSGLNLNFKKVLFYLWYCGTLVALYLSIYFYHFQPNLKYLLIPCSLHETTTLTYLALDNTHT
jgi:hypothetical protein